MSILKKMNVTEALRGKTWEDGFGRGYNAAIEKIEELFPSLIENSSIKAPIKDDQKHSFEEGFQKYQQHYCTMNKLPHLVDRLKYFIEVLEPDIGNAEDYTIIKTSVVPINTFLFFDGFKTSIIDTWENDVCKIAIFIPNLEWSAEIEQAFSRYIDWSIIERCER